MKVRKLISILSKMDPDMEVVFKGYACGSEFTQPVRKDDFQVEQTADMEEPGVVIQADWN